MDPKKEYEEELQKHIEKYKGMSEEEMKDSLSKGNMRKYERLNFAFVRIDLLMDYIRILNDHKTELKSPGSKVIVESGKNFQLTTLYEYIILEITSFYDLVRKIKEDTKIAELPDLPPYWEVIITFRNEITAHLDRHGKYKTIAEWMEQYSKVDAIGIDNIIGQFKKDYFKCYELLKSYM